MAPVRESNRRLLSAAEIARLILQYGGHGQGIWHVSWLGRAVFGLFTGCLAAYIVHVTSQPSWLHFEVIAKKWWNAKKSIDNEVRKHENIQKNTNTHNTVHGDGVYPKVFEWVWQILTNMRDRAGFGVTQYGSAHVQHIFISTITSYRYLERICTALTDMVRY